MPYVRQRVPAVVAVAYVMRSDRCNRAAAMRQLETAALDGALRWVRRGADRWGWDAEVFRTDLLKLWPERPADGASPARFTDMAAPAKLSDIRRELEEVAEWHDQPIDPQYGRTATPDRGTSGITGSRYGRGPDA